MTTPPRPRRPLVGLALAMVFALIGVTLLAAFAGAGEPGSSEQPAAEASPSAAVPTPEEVEAEVLAAVVSAPTATPTPAATPTPVATPTPMPPPPWPAAYQLSENEVLPDAKRVGAAVVYALTNYEVGSSLDELASSVVTDPQQAAAVADVARVVHHPDLWSRGTIEYAQLGGHLDNKASIMVVVRQELGNGDTMRTETRTMDVRLQRDSGGAWAFVELASAGGEPVARPADLSPLAASVVDDPRIDLPDSALWDIYSGDTDAALLQVLADLAERTPFAAVVLHTGHPYHVFETDRVSNHSVGRAIDVYELDGVRVIDARQDASEVHGLVEWLASRTDLKELGSPWKVPNAPTHTFTNEVHQDHVHIGVFGA